MTQNEERVPLTQPVPNAKVYVWKDPEMGETGKPWHVGLIGWADMVIIHHSAVTHAEAWEWLHTNYKRDTV